MKATPILLFALFFFVAACGNSNAEDSLEGRLQVEDFRFSLVPGGARLVTGDLLNTSTQHITNAQIKITLYDADNRRVADMSVTVQDLAPGEKKGFREPVDADLPVQGAKVKSVLVL